MMHVTLTNGFGHAGYGFQLIIVFYGSNFSVEHTQTM